MTREKRLRVGSDEYSLLKAVRDSSDRFDSSIPLGYVVGELARQELAEQFSEDREEPEVRF